MPEQTYVLRANVQPANVESNPLVVEQPVPLGEITHVIAQFPEGCNGHIHAVLEDRHGQVFPFSGDLALNGGAFPFPTKQGIGKSPLRLVAWADASGVTYAHVIDFVVTIDSPEAV